MKIIFSSKVAKNFRIIIIIFTIIGFLIGICLAAIVPEFRKSILFWILAPIILALFFNLLVIGFYLIFLNKKPIK